MKCIILVVGLIYFPVIFRGQDSNQDPSISRIAFVIGVKNYKYAGSLRHTINDANDFGLKLKSLGFDVTLCLDPDLRKMRDDLDLWGKRIKDADVCLVFYSGHGAELNGENYIFPTSSNPQNPGDLDYEAYPVNRIIGKISDAKVKTAIIILDACRDNPFLKSWDKKLIPGKGLANIILANGYFVGFAAQAGHVASDGITGRNGTYTGAILKFIESKGITIDQVFNKVNKEVKTSSDGKQIPFKYSSLDDDFYFVYNYSSTLIKTGALNTKGEHKPRTFQSNESSRGIAKKTVDLSSFLPAVGDQGPEGSSVGFSVAGLIAGTYNIQKSEMPPGAQNENIIQFSPRYIYNSINNRRDQGATLTDALNLLINKGAVQEQFWKYKPGEYAAPAPAGMGNLPHVKIDSFYAVQITTDMFREVLAAKKILLVDLKVFQEYTQIKPDGMLPDFSRELKYIGDIAVNIVGYDDARNVFKVRFSWGRYYGDDGYAYLSYEDLAKVINNAYIVNKVF